MPVDQYAEEHQVSPNPRESFHPPATTNNIRGRVWTLNEASPVPIKPGYVFINSITWQGYTAPGRATIRDHRGDIIFDAESVDDIIPVGLDLDGIPVKGLTVTDLSSGFILVEIS